MTSGNEIGRKRFSGSVFAIEINPVSGTMALAVKGSSYPDAWMDVQATNARSNELLWAKQLNGGFTNIAFSPDSKSFAATESGGVVKIRDTETGVPKVESEVTGIHSGLTFSHDGRRLVVGHGKKVDVIDVETGKKLSSVGNRAG